MGFHIGYETIAEHDLASWAICLYNGDTVTVVRLFGLTLTIDKE